MDRAKEIVILMEDGCTKKEAENHLNVGTIVFDDFEEKIENYSAELSRGDDEFAEEIKKMVETKVPMKDWGIVELDGYVYYIMYCL